MTVYVEILTVNVEILTVYVVSFIMPLKWHLFLVSFSLLLKWSTQEK